MKFEIIAGDFPNGTVFLPSKTRQPQLQIGKEKISLTGLIDRLEVLNEEQKKKILGTAGWATVGLVAGSLIAAPVAIAGVVAGFLKGGNSKEITFTCYLKDGRKFMAVADSKIYTELTAAAF